MLEVLCADISQMEEAHYQQLLLRASEQRQKRAERYIKWEDKLRCVVADGLIRRAVEKTLGISDYSVAQDAMGKPYIQGTEGFHFNLSHSGDWVVIVYGDSPVGIDVQQMQENPKREQKICRLFAEDEAAYVLQADDEERSRRFYEIWTAKESYLKYLGEGLRRALDSFSVLPDGAHLGVGFSYFAHEGYCMTVCAGGSVDNLSQMDGRALI